MQLIPINIVRRLLWEVRKPINLKFIMFQLLGKIEYEKKEHIHPDKLLVSLLELHDRFYFRGFSKILFHVRGSGASAAFSFFIVFLSSTRNLGSEKYFFRT